MRNIDFSSWQSVLLTLVGLALFTLISIGIRLLMMFTIQQRRERMNRQINERLRTLIGAYKTLGGSFTGTLTVDPTHLRDLHRNTVPESEAKTDPELTVEIASGSERRRRIRDEVEAALSDIILLGTEEHVRLAEHVVRELIAGHPAHTSDLVVSLRSFIREALDIGPIPSDLAIPMQGPTRTSSSGTRSKGERGKEGSRQGGGGGSGGGGGMGMGGGMSGGLGIGGSPEDQPSSDHHS